MARGTAPKASNVPRVLRPEGPSETHRTDNGGGVLGEGALAAPILTT